MIWIYKIMFVINNKSWWAGILTEALKKTSHAENQTEANKIKILFTRYIKVDCALFKIFIIYSI